MMPSRRVLSLSALRPAVIEPVALLSAVIPVRLIDLAARIGEPVAVVTGVIPVMGLPITIVAGGVPVPPPSKLQLPLTLFDELV